MLKFTNDNQEMLYYLGRLAAIL